VMKDIPYRRGAATPSHSHSLGVVSHLSFFGF